MLVRDELDESEKIELTSKIKLCGHCMKTLEKIKSDENYSNVLKKVREKLPIHEYEKMKEDFITTLSTSVTLNKNDSLTEEE